MYPPSDALGAIYVNLKVILIDFFTPYGVTYKCEFPHTGMSCHNPTGPPDTYAVLQGRSIDMMP